MLERIKITMLGSSGAGKTAYMVAMYAMMNNGDGLNGFSLMSEDLNQNQKLSNEWYGLLETDNREWPDSTGEETIKYDFNLVFGMGVPVLGFDWFDYRGGALRDPDTAPDVVQLQQRLADTSSIFICVSGEYLAEPWKVKFGAKVGLLGINQLLRKAIQDSGTKSPPALTIVITKYDHCSHRTKEDILQDVKKMFAPYFASGSNCLVYVCPVTLGDGLSSDPMGGDIDPKWLHLPIVFSIFAELCRQNRTHNVKERSMQAEIKSLERNMITRLIRRTLIATKIEERGKVEKDMDKINESLRKLLLILSDDNNMLGNEQASVHMNGKKLSFSDFGFPL